MPVHFHPPDAAAGLPRVSFGSVFTRGGGARSYAALEMEHEDGEHYAGLEAKHRQPPQHEPTRRLPERVPSAPELYALSMAATKAARAHPGAPKSWRRVDTAGEVTTLQVRQRGAPAPRCRMHPFATLTRARCTAAQADKHSIAQRCAIPLRDLRILDVELSTRCAGDGRGRERTRSGGGALTRAARGAAFPRRCCRASAPSSSTWST